MQREIGKDYKAFCTSVMYICRNVNINEKPSYIKTSFLKFGIQSGFIHPSGSERDVHIKGQRQGVRA